MDLILEIVAWLTDPAHWQGANGVPTRLLEHLWYAASSVAVALAVALPVGVWVGHTGRGGNLAMNVANVGRAVPSFGVIILMVVLGGLGYLPVLVALAAFAIPPILTNAYAGIRDVDPEVVDAARGMGMREWQVLTRVELPVASPLLMAGVRTAAVQVVATATLAAVPALGGFGRYIVNGLSVQDYAQVASGAVLVAALALTVEGALAGVQRLVVPASVQQGDAAETVADARSTAGAA